MNKFPVKGIPPSSYFSKTVYLDPHFIVAAPEMPFTEELASILTEWGFTGVLSEGEPMESYVSDDESAGSKSFIGDRSTVVDPDKLQQAEQFLASFQDYVQSLFIQTSVKNTLNFDSVAQNIKDACNFVRENHRFLMRVLLNTRLVKPEDYLVSHTTRSTILSIVIGISIKLPSHRLIELGVATLLHEIGMLKLPHHGYMSSSGPLGEQERKLIFSHSILGYNLLKSCNFPPSVSTAVLEHHERENRTGYPQQLGGEKITLYAKIIAVTCSYEAILSKRPHREARDGYTGMVELLKNVGKQYDDTIVRALVCSLSIYPIGLYVLLSNEKKGQVVDINPENPRYPIVQIFGDLMPDGKNRTMQTSADGLSIIRPLTREEIES
jgi:HD-GYP domain-containing protein (c-di-GMP phosphodiesterase class II)